MPSRNATRNRKYDSSLQFNHDHNQTVNIIQQQFPHVSLNDNIPQYSIQREPRQAYQYENQYNNYNYQNGFPSANNSYIYQNSVYNTHTYFDNSNSTNHEKMISQNQQNKETNLNRFSFPYNVNAKPFYPSSYQHHSNSITQNNQNYEQRNNTLNKSRYKYNK